MINRRWDVPACNKFPVPIGKNSLAACQESGNFCLSTWHLLHAGAIDGRGGLNSDTWAVHLLHEYSDSSLTAECHARNYLRASTAIASPTISLLVCDSRCLGRMAQQVLSSRAHPTTGDSEECCVCVAVHVRPLIYSELSEGCQACLEVDQERPQVLLCIRAQL